MVNLQPIKGNPKMRPCKNRDYFSFSLDYSSKTIIEGEAVVINILLLRVATSL